MTLYEELKWRGLIKDEAGDDLKDIIDKGGATFYIGTDPTADSLHIGHYCSLLTAKRLGLAGHHPLVLIGGATGLIGDPRPTAEREIISKEEVSKNIEGIKKQIVNIFDGNVEVVNNYDWTKDVTIIDFLRDVGKYININYMLDKDIIRRRLETGITFAEFTYTLLQGFDFVHLYETKNCIMQAAGSDQWGNITTGVELINKKLGKKAYAFTMPLILDAKGEKFGKSAGNALWLNEEKTSSYELYQYLINTEDVKVEEYLKVFTFLNKEEIAEIMNKHQEKPEERYAQKVLAKEFISDLHGKKSYEEALSISEALFSGNVKDLTDEQIKTAFKGVESFKIDNSKPLIELLVEHKITSSKREAREFLTGNAISINGEKVSDENFHFDNKRKYNIIRRGKKKYYIFEK